MSDEQLQVRPPYPIPGALYDATEVSSGTTEMLAYGTAVVVGPLEGTGIYGS